MNSIDQIMATPQMTPEGWRYALDPARHHRERNWDYRFLALNAIAWMIEK